jgi:hypothetical protein
MVVDFDAGQQKGLSPWTSYRNDLQARVRAHIKAAEVQNYLAPLDTK